MAVKLLTKDWMFSPWAEYYVYAISQVSQSIQVTENCLQ